MKTLRTRKVEVLNHREQPRELDGDIIAPARSLVVTIRPNTLTICARSERPWPQPTHRNVVWQAGGRRDDHHDDHPLDGGPRGHDQAYCA
jgi:hypothetical protein